MAEINVRGRRDAREPFNVHSPSQASANVHEIEEERRGIAEVQLQKKEGCGLGLTVSGGSDKGCRAQISNLRAGSIAQRSDALAVGDFILSVNGIRISGLKHEEIINLLKNAGESITLELEYEMPEPPSTTANIHSRQWEITLDKEGPGYGFTLRGGMKVENMHAFPLTVVAIRAGSSADRDGQLKVGDRVLEVNGYKVTHLTLTEMWSLMQQCGYQTTFKIAYDVAVMDAVEHASGPLLVEIDKTPGAALGISLMQSSYQRKSCVCVEGIRPMSVADRSGALHVGDHILSIDGASVEHMSVAEATQLLKSGTESRIRLEILPVTHLQHCASREALSRKALVPSVSSVSTPVVSLHNGVSTLPSYSSHAAANSAIAHFATLSRSTRGSMVSKFSWPAMGRKVSSCMSVVSTATSVRTANNQVCHSETTELMLFADVKGLGLTLEGGVFSTAVLSQPPTIGSIDPRSAADRCEVLQEGDRILQVNGMCTTERTLEEINQFLRESRPRCVLEIEFDVAESVTPSCGTYLVKLAKKSGGTGITVGGRRRHRDPLVITDVRRGSVAHRCGSIQPGDKLLAINDVSLNTCTVEDAVHLLELPDDIVKLKLQRDDPDEGTKNCVTYTVQLQRHGGPLGITISGTEDPLDYIIISELNAGGLAQKTGAMHVGDRLLGINDCTTKNKPLSEAIRMLQGAGDIVTLKIARPFSDDGQKGLDHDDFSKPSTPIPSVDSAMESWDSLGQDLGGNAAGGNSQAMVVAIPQAHRFSTASSGPMPSQHSTTLEGSGEAMAETNLSDDDWSEDENEDDHLDCGRSLQSELSSVEAEDWARTLGDLEANSGSEMLRQISASLRQRSTFSLDRRSNASDCQQQQLHRRSQGTACKGASKSQDALHRHEAKQQVQDKEDSSQNRTCGQQQQTIFSSAPIELHRISMEKSSTASDFGFSLSDGLSEKGVFVSAVRTDSSAHRAGIRAYDRILQVNKQKTRDFDCSMTVPLIADARNRLSLVVCRNPLLNQSPALHNSCVSDSGESPEKNDHKLLQFKQDLHGKEVRKPVVAVSNDWRNKDTQKSVGSTRVPSLQDKSAPQSPGTVSSNWLNKESQQSGDVQQQVRPTQRSLGTVSSNWLNKESQKSGDMQLQGRPTQRSSSAVSADWRHSNSQKAVSAACDSLVPEKPSERLEDAGHLQSKQGRNLVGSLGDLNQGRWKVTDNEDTVTSTVYKSGADERRQKASTLPGDGRVGKCSFSGEKPSVPEGKPVVAAKPKVPFWKPPVAAKSNVALAVAKFNSSNAGSYIYRPDLAKSESSQNRSKTLKDLP